MSRYAIINSIILDGTKEMQPVHGKVVLVDNGIITNINEISDDLTGYEIIDLGGQYLCPGLINLHVHIPATGKPKKIEVEAKKLVRVMTRTRLMKAICYKLCYKYALPELLSGVTTIRTVGGILDYDARLRDDIANGKLTGPRIIASNMAISVPGGHMAGSLAYEATSAQQAKEYVGKIADGKADLVKLMITGGVLDAQKKGEPGALKMPAEYVKAACDEAHKRGLKVAAHVEGVEGLKVALQNGVDTIEHGAKPDEEIIELFKKNKAAHVCTISPTLPFALFDRSINKATEVQQYNGNIVFEGVVSCAKACLKNDIPVGLGTDTGCPYTTHYDMWRELYYFRRYCQVTNSFALYSATLGNAKIAQIADETGSIEVGKCADLIACKKNPLENLCALRDLSFVMAKGKVVDITKLKKFPEVDNELDKCMKED